MTTLPPLCGGNSSAGEAKRGNCCLSCLVSNGCISRHVPGVNRHRSHDFAGKPIQRRKSRRLWPPHSALSQRQAGMAVAVVESDIYGVFALTHKSKHSSSTYSWANVPARAHLKLSRIPKDFSCCATTHFSSGREICVELRACQCSTSLLVLGTVTSRHICVARCAVHFKERRRILLSLKFCLLGEKSKVSNHGERINSTAPIINRLHHVPSPHVLRTGIRTSVLGVNRYCTYT